MDSKCLTCRSLVCSYNNWECLVWICTKASKTLISGDLSVSHSAFGTWSVHFVPFGARVFWSWPKSLVSQLPSTFIHSLDPRYTTIAWSLQSRFSLPGVGYRSWVSLWSCSCIKSSRFHSIGQSHSFSSLKYPLLTKKRVQKRYCIEKNSFLEVFSPVSRLMNRRKTPGSEQVDPPVESILGNLSVIHLLSLNLVPSGRNRSTQFWEFLIESTHSSLASTHF